MEFSKLAKRHGFRVTMPRRFIYEILLKGPQTFAGVLEESLAQDIEISTVYRVIEALGRYGVVMETGTGPARIIQLATGSPSNHVHHLRCEICGLISSFNDDALESTLMNIANNANFKSISGHTVDIRGVCGACSY